MLPPFTLVYVLKSSLHLLWSTEVVFITFPCSVTREDKLFVQCPNLALFNAVRPQDLSIGSSLLVCLLSPTTRWGKNKGVSELEFLTFIVVGR